MKSFLSSLNTAGFKSGVILTILLVLNDAPFVLLDMFYTRGISGIRFWYAWNSMLYIPICIAYICCIGSHVQGTKLTKISKWCIIPLCILISISAFSGLKATLPYYINAVRYDNLRFTLEEINVNQLEEITDGNHIVYINCGLCKDCKNGEKYLNAYMKNQSVSIAKYDTNISCQEEKQLPGILENLNVKEVPAVIIYENSILKPVLYSNDIYQNLDDIVQDYKLSNIYFVTPFSGN